VPRALGFKRTAVISPSFHDYIRAARLAGSAVSLIPLSREKAFAPPLADTWKSRIAEADAVFIGNPNNPTGTVFPRKTLLSLAKIHPDKFFLVDEAFVQFLDQFDQITLMKREYLQPNLLVFHSLTKFYSLAGLRLGAVIAHPDTISRLRAFKEPWTVNAVAEEVASLLSSCRNFENKTRLFISQERHRLYERLRKKSGIRVFIPSANFFLIQWTATSNLDDLLQALLSRGLYVRDCRNFPGLEDNFFRFAIRHQAENDRLIDTIAAVAEGPNG
jgi:threonine-phosphate decarboxylase